MLQNSPRPKRDRLTELKIAENIVERNLNLMEKRYCDHRNYRQQKNSNPQRHRVIEELTNQSYGVRKGCIIWVLTTSEIQKIVPTLIEHGLVRDNDHFESIVAAKRTQEEAMQDEQNKNKIEQNKKELRIIRRAIQVEC